jgi:hypothetical protein
MSLPELSSISAVLRRAAVEAAWAQWSAIEAWPNGTPARSVVDPEALVLASLWLESEEPRLWRVAQIWARGGARYLSVQRIKNLAPDYPGHARKRLGDFAWECFHSGKDARWRALATAPTATVRERGKALPPSPQFLRPGALMLRLRIGLGVGIKADVLTYLLGATGRRCTLREMADATGYFRRAVDRAVAELVAAGFVTALSTSPATYRAPEERWAPLLGITVDPPAWWHWNEVYRFAGALDEAAAATAGKSRFLQASRARDVMEAHYPAFELNSVPVREVTAVTGEAYLGILAEDVRVLAKRVTDNWV